MAAREYTSFRDALASPEKVKRLYVIVRSKQSKLPDFRLFPLLEELTLHGALEHVVRFPNVFECTRLRTLTFTGSGITRIPPGFSKLQQLEELALVGHRKLRKLPDDLVELPRLKRLSIDSNRLASLPAGIGRLGALEELVAYSNAIRELPASLYRLRKLKWLELQGNRLTRPPIRLMKIKLRHLQTDFDEVAR